MDTSLNKFLPCSIESWHLLLGGPRLNTSLNGVEDDNDDGGGGGGGGGSSGVAVLMEGNIMMIKDQRLKNS